MANRFLSTTNSSSLSTSTITVASIGVNSLDVGRAVKTDNKRRLISSDLDISDITGLQSVLAGVISTPYAGVMQADNFTSSEADMNALAVSCSNNLVQIIEQGGQIDSLKEDLHYIGTSGSTTNIASALDVLGEVSTPNVVTGGLDLNQFVATVSNNVFDLQNQVTNINTNNANETVVNGILRAENILTHSILDSATQSELLNIDADSVDVLSQAFTFNGSDVATYDGLGDGSARINVLNVKTGKLQLELGGGGPGEVDGDYINYGSVSFEQDVNAHTISPEDGKLTLNGNVSIGARPVCSGGYTLIYGPTVIDSDAIEPLVTGGTCTLIGTLDIEADTLVEGLTFTNKTYGSIAHEKKADLTFFVRFTSSTGVIVETPIQHRMAGDETASNIPTPWSLDSLFTVYGFSGVDGFSMYIRTWSKFAYSQSEGAEVNSFVVVDRTKVQSMGLYVKFEDASSKNYIVAHQSYNQRVF